MASLLDNITRSPKFKLFMKKLALVYAVLTLVGLLMKLRGMSGGNTLLIIGMSTLAFVAFFLGGLFPCPYSIEDDNYVGGMQPIWKFAMTLTGWSLAVGLMGLLFTMMHWPGGMRMLIAGGGALAGGCIAWLFYFNLKKKSNNQ